MSKLLTPQEVAGRLSVNQRTVHLWLRQGKLKGLKVGPRLWRIRESEFQKFMEQGEISSHPEGFENMEEEDDEETHVEEMRLKI